MWPEKNDGNCKTLHFEVTSTPINKNKEKKNIAIAMVVYSKNYFSMGVNGTEMLKGYGFLC